MSILKDSINGTATYSETHTATSDAFGVFSMVVGSGTVVSGSFSAISWGSASHFIKVEMDPAGGSNYQVMGVTQLLSVPYSMYADSAGNVSYSDTSASNELQVLSLSNDTLFLSNGGFVKLPPTTVTPVFNDNEFAIINESGIADAPTTAPNAALAGAGAGSVDNGTHSYIVTYLTSSKETPPSPISDSVTVTFNVTDGKIALTNIPVSGNSAVVARKIYRRFHPSGPNYKLVTIINDNTTTTYTDSIPYISLTALPPITNAQFQFDASQLTQNRTYSLPDKSGVIALSPDVPSEAKVLLPLDLYDGQIQSGGMGNIGIGLLGCNFPALGSYVTFPVFLSSGTYNFEVYYSSGGNRGIIKFLVDDVDQGITEDGWSSSTAFNSSFQKSGVVISTQKIITLKFLSDTKSGSSSGYSIFIQAIKITKTL